ncbi:unnamed protein product [Owenia fusiformis]|uniref:Uncharacterized protein n=1 Tax=Owenia fusiformis TaxID=6347 RepID=A0A8J1UUV5_OWEFU|nr:unnamed protein product [Owenia fusiformis]
MSAAECKQFEKTFPRVGQGSNTYMQSCMDICTESHPHFEELCRNNPLTMKHCSELVQCLEQTPTTVTSTIITPTTTTTPENEDHAHNIHVLLIIMLTIMSVLAILGIIWCIWKKCNIRNRLRGYFQRPQKEEQNVEDGVIPVCVIQTSKKVRGTTEVAENLKGQVYLADPDNSGLPLLHQENPPDGTI